MKMRVWMIEKREMTEGWNWNSTTCQSGYMFQWCWINTFDFKKSSLYYIILFIFIQQIPEGVPVLQTAMASFTPCLWCCHLLSPVPGALTWASLCDARPWNGGARCVFSQKDYACPWRPPDIRHSAQTDKWWGGICEASLVYFHSLKGKFESLFSLGPWSICCINYGGIVCILLLK